MIQRVIDALAMAVVMAAVLLLAGCYTPPPDYPPYPGPIMTTNDVPVRPPAYLPLEGDLLYAPLPYR